MEKLNVVFEDDQILVVDKPAGVVVNRSETIKEETLQDQLAKYFGLALGDWGISGRVGIVHRLDRETSGLLLVAKTQKAFDFLQRQFAERKVVKEYHALVHGQVKDQAGSIETRIGRVGKLGKFGVIQPRLVASIPSRGWKDWGREARTDFEVVNRYVLGENEFGNLLYSSREAKRNREVSLKTDNKQSLRSSQAAGLKQSLRSSQAAGLKQSLRSSSNQDSIAGLNLSGRFSTGSNNIKLGLTKSRINYLKQNACNYTLLRLSPKTGRTHQIRVHLKSIGHPVVSDLIYAPRKLLKFDLLWCPRLFLHAAKLEFTHPNKKRGEAVKFESDLPKDLKNAILCLATSH